jgi:membrane protein YdbS with pleckstrin-like domain
MDPDPTPDPTSFVSYFKDANLPSCILSSVLKIKFLAIIFILNALFQYAQHLYEIREGSGSIPLICGSGSRMP